MKSWIWEHLGNFGLQRPSIQLKCSNFWLSHITHHNFKMCAFLGSAPQNLSLLAPTSGLAWKKDLNPSCFKSCPILVTRKASFLHFLMQHTWHVLFFFSCAKLFFFFGISCTKSCSCLPFFVQHIMPFFCNFSCAKSCLKSCYCNRAR